jgi:hypothetical protein
MNRIQFYVLTGLSILVVLLLIGNILLLREVAGQQATYSQNEQAVSQAEMFQGNLKQIAVRIYQDGQKTQDQGLKDLVVRQGITFTPSPPNTNTTQAPVPPPAATPTPANP